VALAQQAELPDTTLIEGNQFEPYSLFIGRKCESRALMGAELIELLEN